MKLKKQFSDFYKEIEVEDLREKREILQNDIENSEQGDRDFSL